MKEKANNVTFDEYGLPHSIRFDDKYFCLENGLEESIHVFCEGNNLTARFKSLDENNGGVFTIIETGFGTGLNFLCACKLFDELAPESWQLQFITIELYPLNKDDLTKSLSVWEGIDIYRESLINQYPAKFQESQTLEFNQFKTSLTILNVHIDNALSSLEGHVIADAWFFDGFAPRKNPEMWSKQVFQRVGQLSQKATTCATFTVAGEVRRNIQANGFTVTKAKGYGKKRHMVIGVIE